MKYTAVIAVLFSAVRAEDGYTCVNTGDAFTATDEGMGTDGTSESCKTNCLATIASSTDNDYCCASQVTDAVGEFAASSVSCTLYTIATADLDIRAEETAVDGDT